MILQVCCSLAEDLLASVTKLVSISDMKRERYDHIIVECSGIAEPRKIRDLFQVRTKHPREMCLHVFHDDIRMQKTMVVHYCTIFN